MRQTALSRLPFCLWIGKNRGIMYPKLSPAALDTDKFPLSAIPAGLLPHGGTGTTCRLAGAFMACWKQSCRRQLWIQTSPPCRPFLSAIPVGHSCRPPAARRHRDHLPQSGRFYGTINTNKAENGNNRFLPLWFLSFWKQTD